METLEAVSKLWPIFVSVILAVAWIIRIEVNQSYHGKQLENLKKEQAKEIEQIKREAAARQDLVQEKFDDFHRMLSGIKEQLARIEGGLLQSRNKD